MLLGIDAGNTNTTFSAMEKGGVVLHKWRIRNDPSQTEDEYAAKLLPLLSYAGMSFSDFKGAILCSVVPGVNHVLKKFIHQYSSLTLEVVGEGKTFLPVTSLVDRPEAVGDDRLVNFVGASRKFGGPLLVVDFGTATTFDFTDEKGNHLGGCIAPGAAVTAHALSEAGALLPKLPLKKPEHVIGSWTIPQMESGVFWGYVGLFEGLIERMMTEFMENHKISRRPPVIVTGGLSTVFKDVTSVFDEVVPDLTFEGLWHIYKECFSPREKN